MTPVLDQNPCGSCWAFASTGVLDSAALIAGYDLKENISPQQLLDCINTDLLGIDEDTGKPDACNGGGVYLDGFQYFNSTDKRYTISQYPIYNKEVYFTRECTVDKVGTEPMTFKLQQSVATYDLEYEMKTMIMKVGPVYASAYARSWKEITGPVIDKDSCEVPDEFTRGHAVTIVGWDDNFVYNGRSYKVWIIKNSWGTDTGDVFFYSSKTYN